MGRFTRTVSSFAMLAIVLSSLSILGAEGIEGSGRVLFSDYHNGTLNLNVTYRNGTPGNDLIGYWHSANTMYYFGNYLNSTGQTSIDIKWELLGPGEIWIENYNSTRIYSESHVIFPDQVLHRDIVVDPYPGNPIEVTGILRNRSSSLPVAGASVRITGYDRFDNYISIFNTTGFDGKYSIMVPPNMPYDLSVAIDSAPGYVKYSKNIFLKEGTMTYKVDFDLLPKYYPDGLSRIRYINTSSSEPITSGTFYEFINPVQNGHRPDYISKIPDSNGWVEVDSRKGESQYQVETTLPDFPGTYVTISNYQVLNGTPSDMEFDVTPPTSLEYNITVRNSSGVVPGAWISWTADIYKEDARWYFSDFVSTGPGGWVNLALPAGTIVDLQASATGHQYTYFEINTNPLRAIDMEVVIEEYAPSPVLPRGTVRIEVVDDLSGLPIKDAEIYGWVQVNDSFHSESREANGTGVFEGDIIAGSYSYIEGKCSYGKGRVEDVLIKNGTNNPIQIRIDRVEIESPPKTGSFYVTFKEPSGDPVSGLQVWLNVRIGERYRNGYYRTDSSGRLNFNANLNSSVSFSITRSPSDKYNNPWAMERKTLTTPLASGNMGDIVLHPRGDPEEIYGFTRNSVTGEAIGHVQVYSYATHPTSSSRIMVGPGLPEGISLFEHETGSMMNGLYRTWGMDHVTIHAYRAGYYPTEEELDLTTRASNTHDILLDPLPSVEYTVEGTVVDSEGAGIEAYLEIMDNEHPLLMAYSISTDSQGAFSVPLFPGNYTFRVLNGTLMTETVVEVRSDINDLVLVLEPTTTISGIVMNSTGHPAEGIELIIEKNLTGTFEEVGRTTTNSTGSYSFPVNAGEYRIRIDRSEISDPYSGPGLTTNGFIPINHDITLPGRTVADLHGNVTGSGGPFRSGIPGANVTILKDGEYFDSTTSTLAGGYSFMDVPHGVYRLRVIPPVGSEPVEGLRSGYLDNTTGNITLEGASKEVDVELIYQVFSPPDFVNVTYNSPTGEGVYLDTPIMLEFSQVMNTTSFENGFIISPVVANLTFTWDETISIVMIGHDPFIPDTNYTIRILPTVLSYEGFPMFSEFNWTFLTGNVTDPWDIFTADVNVDEGKNLTVNVTAPPGLEIRMFLLNVDYILLTETSPGNYSASVAGESLDWDTEYDYFFTDRDGGLDRAPEYSGTFTTPEEPYVPPVWSITTASVLLKKSGTWDVNVEAPEGQSIFIVIDGIGSYPVQEDAPGYYRVLIPYEEFEWEEEYDYHFSDSSGGSDMATSFSGTIKMPAEPSSGSSSDDPPFYLCCIGILIVLVLIIAVVLIMVMRKRSSSDSWEE
jgi:hypothetical protein